jgi:hypothetical protein
VGVLVLALLMAATVPAPAEEAVETPAAGGTATIAPPHIDDAGFDLLKRTVANTGETPNPAGASAYLPDVWCGSIDQMETRADCWGAFRAGFNYYKSGLAHRQRVFWWQHISGRIIFFVVLGLVVAGVYFAWVQFRHDLDRTDIKGEVQAPQGHELELSTSGLKVSSPVLGVIILALSLAFFYLYLIYVYPIVEIF